MRQTGERWRWWLPMFGLAAAGLLAIGLVAGRPAAARPALPASWALLDGFERLDWPDPGLWLVPDELTAMWRPSACQARSGARSLRAFAGARSGPEAPCNQAVGGAILSQVVMRLDLKDARQATRLDLFFDLWMNLTPADGAGVFVHLSVPQADGSVRLVPVFGATSQSGTWAFPMRRLDLIDLDDISAPGSPIDLRGGDWQLQWSAFAPAGVPAGGGAYIDNVSLVWEPDPAVATPTPRPPATATLTPSATATTRPSATPTASATATATLRPGQAFLPVLRRPEAPPRDTPTEEPVPFDVFLPLLGHHGRPMPTATVTATDTVTPTVTVTATEAPPTATTTPQTTATFTVLGRG